MAKKDKEHGGTITNFKYTFIVNHGNIILLHPLGRKLTTIFLLPLASSSLEMGLIKGPKFGVVCAHLRAHLGLKNLLQGPCVSTHTQAWDVPHETSPRKCVGHRACP